MRAFDSTKNLGYKDRWDWERPGAEVPKLPELKNPTNKTVTCLYIIGKERTGPVKVGISRDPRKRARALDTYESFIVFDGFWFDSQYDARNAESEAHKRLKKQGVHINKEWFRLDVKTAASFVEIVCNEFGDRFVGRGIRCPFKIRFVDLDGTERLV